MFGSEPFGSLLSNAVAEVTSSCVKPNVTYRVANQIISLPLPQFGDRESLTGELLARRTVTGQVFAYVRRTRVQKLVYRFNVSRPKAEEMRTYMLNHLSSSMYMTNWKGEIWYGKVVNNPFQTQYNKRSMPCDGEEASFEIEFEGVRVH